MKESLAPISSRRPGRWLLVGVIAVAAAGAAYFFGAHVGDVDSSVRSARLLERETSPVSAVVDAVAHDRECGRSAVPVENALDAAPDQPVTPKDELARPVTLPPLCSPEASLYLGSFLSAEPDITGWNGYLNQLAASAELDSASVYEDEQHKKIGGHFVVPGSGAKITFTISEEGYMLDSKSTVDLSSLERTPLACHASLAFKEKDGSIQESNGIVQFMPQEGQSYYEDRPVGYIFGMTEGETSFRAVHGEMREGDYCVVVPPKTKNQVVQTGDLGAAYHWMSRLQDVQRSVAAGRVTPRQR